MVDWPQSGGVMKVNLLVAGGVGFVFLLIVSFIFIGVNLMHICRIIGILVDIVFIFYVIVRVYAGCDIVTAWTTIPCGSTCAHRNNLRSVVVSSGRTIR